MVINIIDQYQSIDAQGRRRFHVAFSTLPTRQAEEEMRAWCVNSWGLSSLSLTGTWNDRIQYGEVDFACESDLALFIMRWS